METKLKFKVGDKVRVKSLEWYNDNKLFNGNVYNEKNRGVFFSEDMSKLCGEIVQITRINEDSYHILGNKMYWQDWMFEDEAVTEERQEIEQFNKNMETKLKFKVGDKVRVKSLEWYNEKNRGIFFSEDMSKLCGEIVQITSIDEDYSYHILGNKMYWQDWMFEDEPVTEEKQEDKQTKEMTKEEVFAYLGSTKILCTSTEETAEVQEKFDPNTLKPFDKVLVRDSEKGFWRCDLFSHLSNEDNYQCVATYWIYCIPYNEETKHLVGTTNEAPDYYKNWGE